MPARISTKSLKSVIERAFEKEKFYKALARDPVAALKAAKIRLSQKDLRKLKGFLNTRSVESDYRKYRAIAYRFNKKLGFLPW